MEEAIVYEATLKTKTGADNYVGIVEKDFKSRYYNHKTSFNNSTKRNATALSAKYHDAIDNKETPTVRWAVLHKSTPYRCGSRKCDLCLTEKLAIL